MQNSFGRRLLLAELGCFAAWLAAFTAFVLLWQVRM